MHIPEGDEEDPLTPAQESFVADRVRHCADHVRILKADEVRRICIDFEFDAERVEEYLAVYAVEEKYKGIDAFQWQETVTVEQKNQMRRKKKMESERKKRNETRLKKQRAEREELRRE